MNTEIRKIIEKIESDQQELERLVQERTVIMKNETIKSSNTEKKNNKRKLKTGQCSQERLKSFSPYWGWPWSPWLSWY